VGSEYLMAVEKEGIAPPSRLQWLLRLIERWDVAWVLIVLNFIGFVGGIILWYGDHFLGRAAGKWYLWPFIPDCPGFAFLFIIAFLGLLCGRDWRLFNTITAYGLIKYGVWTVLYWIAYWLRGGPVELLGMTMFLSHLGMIGEGLYVSYRISSPLSSKSVRGREKMAAGFRRRDVLIAFAWFLLSDYVDYGLGQYPMFNATVVPMALMEWHTIFMTFALAAVYFALSRQRRGGATPNRWR